MQAWNVQDLTVSLFEPYRVGEGYLLPNINITNLRDGVGQGRVWSVCVAMVTNLRDRVGQGRHKGMLVGC